MLSTAWLLLSTISSSSSALGHEGGEGRVQVWESREDHAGTVPHSAV